jgi:hypothetical protein
MGYMISNIVGQVRDSLKGVTGFDIVKEFIQNADDSGASHWIMGYSQGVSDCQHPLLQCPAIYVVNDGSFEPKHAEGLARINESTKASEGDSVGKFGLGLKSVYQICEAFFFWPSCKDIQNFSDNDEYSGHAMMTPWTVNGSESERGDWEKDFKDYGADDIAKIRQYLKERNVLDGFTLWIPLRQKNQLEVDGEEQYIHPDTYDDGAYPENIFSKHLMSKLASLWPMLRSIETMEVRAPHQEPVSISLFSDTRRQFPRISPEEKCSDDLFTVELSPDKELVYDEWIALPKKQRALQGEIETDNDVKSWFTGFEVGVPELRSLRQHKRWPKRGQVAGKTKNRDVPDKSTPHAAAVFQLLQQEPNTPSQLDIQWAVFFPVGDAQSLDIPLQGVRIQLLLHGFFLLAADRKSISALHDGKLQEALGQNQDNLDSQQKLEHLWNAKLATEGTLKLVLPALDAFAKQLAVIDAATYEERITALTKALQRSDFFKHYCQDLTTEWQWVKRVNAGASATWQLVKASADVFVLSEPNVAFKIFPKLQTLCETHVFHVFIEAESPSLTKSKPRKEWTNEILEPCLAAADVGTVQELLQADDNLEKIKEVLKHIPQTHRLKLPSLDLLEKLRGVSLGVALIPPEVGIPCDAKLSIEGAEVILRKLENIPDISEFIITVIKACKEADKNDLADSINNLKIFEVTSVQGEPRWLSLQDLRKAPLLFKKRGNQDTFGTELDAVLDDTHLTLIDNTLADKLKENFALEIKSCNRDACIRVLEAKPRLVTESEPRLELFHKLRDAFKQRPNPTQVQALRYLLHADREHFKDDAPLFMPSSEDEGVWDRLCQKILTIQAKAWCWLEKLAGLHTRISSNELSWYQLKVASADTIEVLLKEVEGDVRLPALIDEEYDALLEGIKDINLLKRLPIHETTNGERVAIKDGKTFLASDRHQWEISPELIKGVQFIKRHKRLDYRQKSKQGLGLTKLEASDVIKRALSRDFPYYFWHNILQMLSHIQTQSTAKELMQQLQDRPWLEMHDNQACKPCQVIRFDDSKLQDHADTLLVMNRNNTGGFVSFNDLHEDIRKHEHVEEMIKKVLPKPDKALANVGEVLGKTPKYYIGELSAVSGADDDNIDEIIKKWHQAFGDGDVFPVWDWLKHDQLDKNNQGKIWQSVTKKIDAEKINEALKYLCKRHQQGTKDKEVVLEVHNWYLELAVAATEPAWQLTNDVWLLNQVGDWCEPSKLCHGQMGVHKGDLVCEAQAEILKPAPLQSVASPSEGSTTEAQNESSNPEKLADEAPDTLRRYFNPWRDTDLDDAVVGVLLALLGSHPEVQKLNQVFLPNYLIEDVRERLGVAGEVEKNSVIVTLQRGDTYSLTNLLGESFQARKEQEPSGLLMNTRHNPPYMFIQLADFVPNSETSRDRLKTMIRGSIEMLLEEVYKVSTEAVADVLDDVEDRLQFSLRAAQNLIIKHALYYLEGELGAKSPKLNELFDDWDDADRREAQRDDDDIDPERQRQINEKRKTAQRKLKELLKDDKETQKYLLDRVREKLNDYQYKIESIPFELFQNADDALVQLSDVKESLPNKTFKIKAYDGALYVMHWGRLINDALGTGERRYEKDLEKMLTLGSSAKTEQVTGKFGLGFKSVFFLTEKPEIISGNLSVKIEGGVYPNQRLYGSDGSDFLREELNEHGDDKHGTIIYLPFDDGTKDDLEDVLQKFHNLAPYMLLFTRAADRCEIIEGENEHKTTIRWQEEVVLPNVIKKQYRITTVLQFKTNVGSVTTVLQFKTNVGSVVFKVGHKGIERFDNIPTLWVTAPTEEDSKLGFLINGDFDVDVGRARLGAKEKNEELAKRMAGELVEAFKKLAAMDWEKLCSALALEVSKEDFWRSFFECLTQGFDGDEAVVTLAQQIFWGEQGAATHMLQSCPVLPNGFSKELTQLSDVQHYVSGLLARDFAIFQSWLPSPQSIIHQKVYNALKKCHVQTDIKKLTLEQVLKKKLRDSNTVSPDTARQLGQVITSQWLEQHQKSETFDEMKEIRDVLHKARFQAQDGHYYLASQLLSKSEPTSLEAKRASIAPLSRRIHEDYQDEALTFFKLCRSGSGIKLDEIAAWVLNASGEVQQQNAINCILADVSLINHLCQHDRTLRSWLGSIQRMPWLKLEDWLRLRALLGLRLEVSLPQAYEEEELPSFQLVNRDPKGLLEQVYAQWQRERESRIAEHTRKTYPAGVELMLKREPDLTNPQERKSWLVLLLLGSFLTLGRVKPEQNRGFLEDFDRRGWLDTFADFGNKDKWFDFIEDYFQRDTDDYRYWMMQFVSIYQISSWLDIYVPLICGLDKADDQTIRQGVWNPRRAAVLSGTGTDAPSLEKVLKLGRHFVLRELVRREVLTLPKLYPYCFVPSSRTRQAFAAMGCQVSGEDTMTASRQIYEFAKEHLGAKQATFDMDFDLPFYYRLHER